MIQTYKYEILDKVCGGYGLLVKEWERNGWVAVAVTTPFSRDKAAVSALAEKCTRLQLSPIHLMDIIRDFIDEAGVK